MTDHIHDIPPTPRRRWFRFGLRTMFVVLTVFSLWLGYYANWLHKRRFGREWIESHEVPGNYNVEAKALGGFPWTLRLFGEEPFVPNPDDFCVVVANTQGEADRIYLERLAEIRRLFPEAPIEDVTVRPRN